MLAKHQVKWDQFKRHGDQQARADLICEFVPLVHYVFGRMSLYLPNVLDDSDLIAAGTIGLISAVDTFDIERGLEFSTHAVPRIRGAIRDELRKHGWLSRVATIQAAKLAAVMEKAQDDGRRPNFGKVAKLMGIKIGKLSKLMSRLRYVSFAPLSSSDDNNDAGLAQFIADDSSRDPAAEAELADQLAALSRALDTLPSAERHVIIQRYCENRKQKDIAVDLGLHESRVTQLRTAAVAAVRDQMEDGT